MNSITVQTIKKSRISPKKVLSPMIKSLRKLENTFEDQEFLESKKSKSSFENFCQNILKDL